MPDYKLSGEDARTFGLRYEISEVTTRRHISVIGLLGVKRGIMIWDFFWFGEVRNQTSHKKLVCPLPSQLMPVELERGLL